ncbi:MAG TPA: twin-arginine translocase subunit TatC [Gemmatimonadetes bacterium]|nr:twin-arginine translocase subunit TatC [Gemmatimonadota bacterium]
MRHNTRGEMPFLDHLEELRWRIFKAGGALILAAILGFVVVHYLNVTQILIRPALLFLPDGRLSVFDPLTPFFFEIRLAIILGLIGSFPIILFEIWSFLSPALERREKRIIIPALYMGMGLFAFGVGLAYFVALPITLKFLYGFQTDTASWLIGMNEYLSFVIRLLLSFGIIFELPVVIMILASLGLVTPKFLRAKRRHAIVITTVVAAFLSPGDAMTVTFLMMFPLIILYEVSIVLAAFVRKRPREEEDPVIQPPTEPPEGVEEAE